MAKTKFAPLIFSLAFFLLLIGISIYRAYTLTSGHFGYPLDDTYIHMAISKHMVNDGIWGVSQAGFSSSTSSPLWTLLIVLSYLLFGVNDWSPIILSVISGISIIFLVYYLLRNSIKPLFLSLLLFFIILFTPLPIMALTGMEHNLHILLTLLLTYSSASILSKQDIKSSQIFLLLSLSMLVTVIRYEGLFLVLSISFMCLLLKKYRLAILVSFAGLLPVIVYGLISLKMGGFFFPNSILLKGNIPAFNLHGIAVFFGGFTQRLLSTPHILALLIACLLVYLLSEGLKIIGIKEQYLTLIFISSALLHLLFADVGWFYRYEAYLLLVGLVILIDMVCALLQIIPANINRSQIGKFIIPVTAAILVIMPLAIRASFAFRDYPLAVKNIYEQQYQMGLFIRKYYEGESIAANDIGAINYLADIKTLDLTGLGSTEIIKAKNNGVPIKTLLSSLPLSHNVQIVMIYNSWFEGKIPPEWIEIGSWKIYNNVVCGSNVVTFYTPTAILQSQAYENLREFSDLLPKTVQQTGSYLEQQ